MPTPMPSLQLHRLLVVALLGVALPALGQTLGDAARREQEKKGTKRAPAGRTYGDEDLKSRRGPGAAASPALAESPSRDASPSPAPSPSPSPEPDRAALEREWRRRFAESRARLAEEDARAWGRPDRGRVRVRDTRAAAGAREGGDTAATNRAPGDRGPRGGSCAAPARPRAGAGNERGLGLAVDADHAQLPGGAQVDLDRLAPGGVGLAAPQRADAHHEVLGPVRGDGEGPQRRLGRG